ncbi:MAG: endolytic transglycosylase MltG [Patescibacteria group bacterium]
MKFRIRAFGIFAALVVLYAFLIAPPLNYPTGMTVQVAQGESVGAVADNLYLLGAIQSRPIFKLAVILLGGSVQAGAYLLDKNNTLFLAYRMTRGETGLEQVRITIREGMTLREIEKLVGTDLPDDQEGYLFPDTYDFLPGSPADLVVARMHSRYEEHVAPLRAEIEASGHTEEEIIILASILEKEARQPETMRIVSGILWDRIKIGMPLQVDAVFGYINNRPTYHPSGEDLEIDSPYNTYKYPGLPPGPIGNPGMTAIEAALRPGESPYLYYLTGVDGTMHYAKTFEEHVRNRRFLK